MESFFGTLKRALIDHRQFHTRDEATQDIFEYIEVLKRSIIDCVVTSHSATTPRPSSKRGRLWLNRVSMELGEGQIPPSMPACSCFPSG